MHTGVGHVCGMILHKKENACLLQDFHSGVLSSDACLSANTKLQSLYKDVAKVLYGSKQPKGGDVCLSKVFQGNKIGQTCVRLIQVCSIV